MSSSIGNKETVSFVSAGASMRLEKLAKEKLDEYEYNTAHINNLTDNQTRHSRASIRPDHIGKIHSH